MLQSDQWCDAGNNVWHGMHLQGGQKCGESNNFWEYYEEDIARVVALNSTCFRLSLGAAHIPLSHQSSHSSTSL